MHVDIKEIDKTYGKQEIGFNASFALKCYHEEHFEMIMNQTLQNDCLVYRYKLII